MGNEDRSEKLQNTFKHKREKKKLQVTMRENIEQTLSKIKPQNTLKRR